jgi:transitional endoplasmic reticulum ATPase
VGESVGNVRVTMQHFEGALDEVNPSVTPETRERYEEIEEQFRRSEVDRAETEPGTAFQ